MTIQKNSPIKVTLKDGSTILANVTKIAYGPTEAHHMVCWIAKDRTWKGKMPLAKAVKATPEECRDWAIAHAAKMAPLHPIMTKWELGNTKRGPMMMEGYYFSVPVLLHGKKVGEIVDEGLGGSNMTRFDSHEVGRLFGNDCREWCKANGASMSYLEAESEFWTWWDEARPVGKDAATYFKEQKERLEEMTKGQIPITNSDAFANAVNNAPLVAVLVPPNKT